MASSSFETETANTLSILISTDNHLGYAEKDHLRGNDSFETFDEVLSIAKKHKVDMVLLGGDLFHDNKPSRKTMYRTMNYLRKHCMGNGAISFQIVSDQSLNFPNFGTVNYEDPNYNVNLPIFSIHGNHDDPTREGGMEALAALDILSVANLVNYFGKAEKVDDIEIFPILILKGTTKIAIYGLGSMRDERLNRMFAQKKVKFRRPIESPDEWFNIFVVHQNRDNRGRGAQNCVHESFIPEFIDFVVWGHEHECCIHPEESMQGNFFITQPGSSIATSLVEGEARSKHVALLEIKDQQFRLTPIPLETVRPFVIQDTVLAQNKKLDATDPDVARKITEVLKHTIQGMIRDYQNTHPENKKEILVRLRVDHSGFPRICNNNRFGIDFIGKVANPTDMLLFSRKREMNMKHNKNSLQQPILPDQLVDFQVEDLILQHLDNAEKKLVLLKEPKFNEALENFVYKNIPAALGEFVDKSLEDMQRYLNRLKTAKGRNEILDNVEKTTEYARAEYNLAKEQQQQLYEQTVLEEPDPSILEVNEHAPIEEQNNGRKTMTRSQRHTTSNLNSGLPLLESQESDNEFNSKVERKTRSKSSMNSQKRKNSISMDEIESHYQEQKQSEDSDFSDSPFISPQKSNLPKGSKRKEPLSSEEEYQPKKRVSKKRNVNEDIEREGLNTTKKQASSTLRGRGRAATRGRASGGISKGREANVERHGDALQLLSSESNNSFMSASTQKRVLNGKSDNDSNISTTSRRLPEVRQKKLKVSLIFDEDDDDGDKESDLIKGWGPPKKR